MKNFKTKLMIEKEGRKPARIGLLDVLANSEQEALDVATAEAKKAYERSCTVTGIRNETTRVWAELV